MPFSGYQDLDPRFAGALQQLIAGNAGITPFSGYRSIERQRQLFEASDKSGHMVARPGHSQHNFGRAVDLKFADQAARDYAHAKAAELGLNFPMSYEPWHIELAGARDSAPGAPAYKPAAQAGPLAAPSTGAGLAPTFKPADQQQNPMTSYMRGIMGIAQGGGSDWMSNTSYSADALLGDVLAGHSPLRRLMYQKVMGLFS